MKNTLVIIPARGGSKRIPRKNIKNILGQPMIYWPLMELSKVFSASSIIVSTDDEEIVSTVETVGLNVPFRRPEALSDDYMGTMPVITHALQWYEAEVSQVEYVVVIYPTAVTISVNDINEAFNMLQNDENCDSVMSATHFPFPIQRAVFSNQDGYAEMFEPQHYHSRSQDLIESLHDAGQFYVYRSAAVRANKILTNSNVKPYLLHPNRVIDIDTIEDFQVAEAKLELLGYSDSLPKWSFPK